MSTIKAERDNTSLLDDLDLRRPLCFSEEIQHEIRREQCHDDVSERGREREI